MSIRFDHRGLNSLVRNTDAWVGVALVDLWGTMVVDWALIYSDTYKHIQWIMSVTTLVWVGMGTVLFLVERALLTSGLVRRSQTISQGLARVALLFVAIYFIVARNNGLLLGVGSWGSKAYVLATLFLLITGSWYAPIRQRFLADVIISRASIASPALAFLVLSTFALSRYVFPTPFPLLALSLFVTAYLMWRLRDGHHPMRVLGVLIVVPSIFVSILHHPTLRLPLSPGEAAADRNHSVLLITIDTLRKDVVGAYHKDTTGSSTPQIDSLAALGVTFDHAVSASPWTVPALASILTGEYPARHSAKEKGTTISGSVGIISEAARDAGFITAAVVSNPFLNRGSSFERGFEYYCHLPADHQTATVGQGLAGIEQGDPRGLHDESAVGVRDVVEQLLRTMRSDPFFMWAHFIDPHLPYTPHSDSLVEIIDKNDWRFLTTNLMFDIRTGRRVLTSSQKRILHALYLDEVRFTDQMIGGILHTLRSLGLEDEVTVVVTSDHGEEFWDHGGYEHGHTLYDELTTVPLIVKPVGFRGPLRIPDLVTTASLAPTICELLSSPPGLGTLPSLVPYWMQPASGGGRLRHVISDAMLYFGPGRAVQTKRFKFIDWPAQGKRLLFDLQADPGENSSLPILDQPVVQEAESVLSAYAPLGEESTPLEENETLTAFEIERLRVLGYTD